MNDMNVNPEGVRTANPSSWPQYPYNEPPPTPEASEIRYSIYPEYARRLRMKDGVELAYDVMRPFAPGQRFPALLSWSPYTRQLQYTLVPNGQNEAGLTEFWVPRGYVQVIVDVRGSNDSDGSWDHWGPQEQADLKETIAWIAEQPWCNGQVGMVGVSYFAMSQLLAAEQEPDGLTAIFPYDAMTDLYRDAYYHGGIYCHWRRSWFQNLMFLNETSGRVKDLSGFRHHIQLMLLGEEPFDGAYYWERSAWPKLGNIKTPAYFGCDWTFFNLHLRGAFSGWSGLPETTPKKMFIGPKPKPRRPFGFYHFEALRWYDYYLKGMDTGVWEGAPIQLYIQGENTWRGEAEWPLARTDWVKLYLDGGTLTGNAGNPGEQAYTFVPGTVEARRGEPRLTWRTEPMDRPIEITGPMVLHLLAASDQDDTDWFVFVYDEALDGSPRLLTRGFLKASHRAVDRRRSTAWQPWHPHNREEPVPRGEVLAYEIEIVPTCNVFQPGHRLRLDLASCDPVTELQHVHDAQVHVTTNTVITGRDGSYLLTPFIPR